MSLNLDEYFTIDQLAEAKGVVRRTVHLWIKKCIAPPHERLLGRIMFRRGEAEGWEPPKKGRPLK